MTSLFSSGRLKLARREQEEHVLTCQGRGRLDGGGRYRLVAESLVLEHHYRRVRGLVSAITPLERVLAVHFVPRHCSRWSFARGRQH